MHGKLSRQIGAVLGFRRAAVVRKQYTAHSHHAVSATGRMLGISEFSRIPGAQTEPQCLRDRLHDGAHTKKPGAERQNRFRTKEIRGLRKFQKKTIRNEELLFIRLAAVAIFRGSNMRTIRIHSYSANTSTQKMKPAYNISPLRTISTIYDLTTSLNYASNRIMETSIIHVCIDSECTAHWRRASN